MRTAQNSFVFGTRCFEIINSTRNIFFDSACPEIRLFFGGLDRVVLSRIPAPSQLRAGPAREIRKKSSPGQLGRAPAERLFMVWLPNSSKIPQPPSKSIEKSWKSIEFLDFSSIRTGQPLASPRRGTPFFGEIILTRSKCSFSKFSSFR